MTVSGNLPIASACLTFIVTLARALPDSSSLIQQRLDVSRSVEERAALAPSLKVEEAVSSAQMSGLNESKLLGSMVDGAKQVANGAHLGASFGGINVTKFLSENLTQMNPDAQRKHDVFPNQPGKHGHKDGDEGWKFFQSAPWPDWVILCVACIVLMFFDWFVLRRIPESFKAHIGIVLIWVAAAAIYDVIIYGRMGSGKATEWCTGYLLEWMLSMDNLFVFHLVFTAYQTPEKQIHKAVFIGIIGAVVMRMIFFMVVSTLLSLFGWFRWPFGALLVWSGIEAARGDDDDDDEDAVKDSRLIRALKYCLGDRLMEDYDPDGERCFIKGPDGRIQATVLVVVICCLEFTDILFALDSVSAKVAQIPDQYIAFSSSVIAMFGLRALFFIIKDLVEMFDLLKYGLCLILIFIGVELMFARWIHLSSATVCILIVGVFVICIIASRAQQLVMKRLAEKKKLGQSKGHESDSDASTAADVSDVSTKHKKIST